MHIARALFTVQAAVFLLLTNIFHTDGEDYSPTQLFKSPTAIFMPNHFSCVLPVS